MTKAEIKAAELEVRRKVVDEYGDLVAELAPWKQKLSRRDDLAKIIREWFSDSDAGVSHTIAGAKHEVVLGEKQLVTRIDTAKVWSMLGRQKFLEICSLTMKAIEAHLPAAALAVLVSKDRTGTRSLVVHAVAVSAEVQQLETDIKKLA